MRIILNNSFFLVIRMKFLKKDMEELLNKLSKVTDGMRDMRFGQCCTKPKENKKTLREWLRSDEEFNYMSEMFTHAIITLIEPYRKYLEEKSIKPYMMNGYSQLIRGRNQYNSKWCK